MSGHSSREEQWLHWKDVFQLSLSRLLQQLGWSPNGMAEDKVRELVLQGVRKLAPHSPLTLVGRFPSECEASC